MSPVRARTRRLTQFACVAALAVACKQEPPPGAQAPERTDSLAASPRIVGTPAIPSELAVQPSAAPPAASDTAAAPAAPGEAAPPYAGPWFVVTEGSAGVYPDTSVSKKQKLGYLRGGSKVPVFAALVAQKETRDKDDCRGWYRLRDGGFVCASAGTTNLTSPEARFATKAPNLDAVLPYTYARNAKNGTPLYRSVPTAEQMRTYEPYLVKQDEKAQGAKPDESTPKPAPGSLEVPRPESTSKLADSPLAFAKTMETAKSVTKDPASQKDTVLAATAGEASPAATAPVAAAPAGPGSPDGGVDDSTKPWWQRHDVDKRLHEVKLGELEADADAILAKRMVKGFYVAVDREFNWNGRPWYKTTKGLVAPADRFWITKGSEFQGVELDGEKLALPVGWTYGWAKTRSKYEIDTEHSKIKTVGTIQHHASIALTGKEFEIGGKRYVEAKDGFWLLASQLRITKPGPPPSDLGPNERWIDVNLKTQTLVVFEGEKAIYATLISSGKENKEDKEKDHSTPTGDYRIREKHVTTTMDGDGSAAGDLPYSIEDVPYVMYFHKAYALHGAFWHANYGSQMSHGCVNLAPLDAKWVFLNTEPRLPEGWHGVWSSETHPGSRVLVHE